MGIDGTINVLSNINAFLGSAASALEGKNKGDDWGTSLMNFGMHSMNGVVRNTVAKDIKNQTGSSIGYIINGLAGYGTNEADQKGMTGLFGASMMTNPWFGGGMFGGCMGGSLWGGSLYGGCFGGSMMMPMMPMMPTSYTEVTITTSGGGCHHGHWRC